MKTSLSRASYLVLKFPAANPSSFHSPTLALATAIETSAPSMIAQAAFWPTAQKLLPARGLSTTEYMETIFTF